MAHALLKTKPGPGDEERYQYEGKVVRDLNSPDKIIIELDDGTVYQIGLKANFSEAVGLQVRLIESPNRSAALVVQPEVANSVVFYPAPEDI
jgi:hypothetical protein